jgi:predicted transcriptional regulator
MINYFAIPGIVKSQIKSNIDEIFKAIFDITGITSQELISPNRHRNIADTRKMLVNLINENHKFTLSKIGGMINRDHATIIHALRNHKLLYENDRTYQLTYNKIINELNKNKAFEKPDETIQSKKQIIETSKKVLTMGRCLLLEPCHLFNDNIYVYELVDKDLFDNPYYRVYYSSKEYKSFDVNNFLNKFKPIE